MKEHKCDKMFSVRDIQVKAYYDKEKKRHIYYCHYCGTELTVVERNEDKTLT